MELSLEEKLVMAKIKEEKVDLQYSTSYLNTRLEALNGKLKEFDKNGYV